MWTPDPVRSNTFGASCKAPGRSIRFEAADAAGQFHPVKANATLTYDQYGNVTVAGTLLEPLPGQQTQDFQPMLKYSGRIVIDTQKHEFRLQAQEGIADPSLQGTVGAGLITEVRHHGHAVDDHLRHAAGQADGANNLQEIERQVRPVRSGTTGPRKPTSQSASFPKRVDARQRVPRTVVPVVPVVPSYDNALLHSYPPALARQLTRSTPPPRIVPCARPFSTLPLRRSRSTSIAPDPLVASSVTGVAGGSVTSILPDCVRTECCPRRR